MKAKIEKDYTSICHKACIAMVWMADFYSGIIQCKYREISYAMLSIGIAIFIFYYLANSRKPYILRNELTEESMLMLLFMIYMFSVGSLVAIDRKQHLSQALTSLQYFFVLVVVSSLIRKSGTDSFHLLLLIKAVTLVFVFLLDPVPWPGNRYSISKNMNPNGLGIYFASGIWATLYWQQKRKMPLVISAALVAALGYCIVNTGSRKSFIAACLMVFVWILYCFIPSTRKKGSTKKYISLVSLIIIIFVVGWLFYGLYKDSTIADRMGKLLYETQEGNRSQMYSAGLQMLKSNPLFGIGFQGFKYLYGLYSHATVVEIPVSGGVIGAILYFYIYVYSIKKSYILFRKTKQTEKYDQENIRIRMIILLWLVMILYSTCIIHQYQFESFILFGIIFGETAYIEDKIGEKKKFPESKDVWSKYIK